MIYSGAGISVAAGLGQAARSSGDPDGDPQVEHYLPAHSAQCHGYPQLVRGGRVPAARHEEAGTTLSHAALVSLHSRGLVATWVQQNHDGLAQKVATTVGGRCVR